MKVQEPRLATGGGVAQQGEEDLVDVGARGRVEQDGVVLVPTLVVVVTARELRSVDVEEATMTPTAFRETRRGYPRQLFTAAKMSSQGRR